MYSVSIGRVPQRVVDWGAASGLLKGVYSTLAKYPYIAHLPHLKMVLQVCQVRPQGTQGWTNTCETLYIL